MTSDSGEWPQTIRVGGEEYELHPDMPMSEFMDAQGALAEEVEKLQHLARAMGMIPERHRRDVFGGAGSEEDMTDVFESLFGGDDE